MGRDPVLINILKTCLMSGSNPWSSSLSNRFSQNPDAMLAQADLAEPKKTTGKGAHTFKNMLTNRYRLITFVM